MACTTGASTHGREPTNARAGVTRKAHRDKPPWVLYPDKIGSPCVATGVFRVATGFLGSWGFGVATRLAHLVSRHSLLVSQ